MGRASWHAFLVLTKRPERMLTWARERAGELLDGEAWRQVP
jgi:hypothetical protein